MQDVAKVGRRHEVKEVADGFGQNFLIARGKALPATPANLKKVEALRQTQQAAQVLDQQKAQALIEALGKQPIKMSARANPEGHLFAGIHAPEIAEAIKRQTQIAVNPEWIDLAAPIKTSGTHELKLKTSRVIGTFQLEIAALS